MAEKIYPLKRYQGWLGKVFIRLGLSPSYKNLPLFGVQGAGKSYFLLSLGYFISARKLGSVLGESADYINQFLPVMMRGERLDATPGYRDMNLKVERVYRSDHDRLFRELDPLDPIAQHHRDLATEAELDTEGQYANFVLSTKDLSGTQFKDAMDRLSDPSSRLGGDPQTQRFLQVLEGGDGAIVVVDVVRQEMTAEQFTADRKRYIRLALAEQVVPLVRGIQLSLLRGKQEGRFPLFLVFTKRDIHGLSRHELEAIVREVFAILLANLDKRVMLRIHSVQNIGFGVDPDSFLEMELKSEGVGLFLADVNFWL